MNGKRKKLSEPQNDRHSRERDYCFRSSDAAEFRSPLLFELEVSLKMGAAGLEPAET